MQKDQLLKPGDPPIQVCEMHNPGGLQKFEAPRGLGGIKKKASLCVMETRLKGR